MSVDPAAVPGTVRLVDVRHALRDRLDERGDIILVPQPSADPEDPLNWSRWRKARSMGLAHLYTFVIAWASSCVYSILVDVSEETGLSVSTLNEGSGTMLLFFGWGSLLAQPIALTYGRRGTLLASLLATVAVSVWTAYAPSYAAWVSNRVVLGLVGSPIEVVPEMIVTDLYFNHERGTQITIYAVSLATGSFLCSLFSGLINDSMGWQWVMYWTAIICAIASVAFFFGFEETMYFRNTGFEAARATDSSSTSDEEEGVLPDEEPKQQPKQEITPAVAAPEGLFDAAAASTTDNNQTFPPPRPYWKKLMPFRLIPGKSKYFLTYMYLPLKNLYTYPIVLWAAFYHGIAVICFNAMNATTSLILSAPPYNWKSTYIGLSYIGPVIGALVGTVWAGVIGDRICLAMARRNKSGLREAEYRLYAAIVMVIIPPAGFILWGVGAAHGVHWVGLIFGMGMLGFAMPVGGSIVMNYATDSYKELQGSTMTSLNVLRCTMAFGFGYAVTPWLERTGIQNTFITWCFMSIALFATFIPMIFWGKKLRIRSTPAFWDEVNKSVGLYH